MHGIHKCLFAQDDGNRPRIPWLHSEASRSRVYEVDIVIRLCHEYLPWVPAELLECDDPY